MRRTGFRWVRLPVVASMVAAALVPAPVSAAAAVYDWSKRLGGPSYDFVESVAVDPSGAVVVAGYTYNYSIDMGGGWLSGPGHSDFVVAKYSSTGAHLWSNRFGNWFGDEAHSVAVDASGAVLLAGETDSTSIDMGGGPLPASGAIDMVLAKFSSTGEHIWSKRLGGATVNQTQSISRVHSVATDATGAVLLAGHTNSTQIDMGGGPLPGAGSDDMVVAKFASSGAHLWSKRLGSSAWDAAYSVAADSSGAVLVSGASRSSTIDLGGGPLPRLGNLDMVLAKFSSSGAHQWSKRLGGSGDDIASSATMDAAGAVLLAGGTSGPSIDLGGGPLPASGESDMVVAKLSSSGAHLWSKRFGGSAADLASSVAVDASGSVLLAGSSRSDRIDLGAGPLLSSGASDMVIAMLSSSGAHLWSKRLGSSADDILSSATMDATGAVLLAGHTSGPSIDLGGGPHPGSGDTDMVVARYRWDDTAPVSAMQTVQVGAGVTGTATDDIAGVEGVTVAYTNLVTNEVVVVEATLVCDPPRLSCSFSDAGPGLGVWRVNARARDRAANVEIPDSMSTLIATT